MIKILLSNDDGVHAPGMTILAHTLRSFAEVTIVAPLTERSSTGHTLTLDHPLRIVEIGPQTYGCSGFPADCVLMGLAHLMKEDKPDLVISGINKGANLGQDIYYSGTVAAAREAVFRGVKAIAVSSAMDFLDPNPPEDYYYTAAKFVAEIVKTRLYENLKPRELLNINVPDCPNDAIKGISLTSLGFRQYSEDISARRDFKNRDYYWVGGVYSGFDPNTGSDCHAVDQGEISVSILSPVGVQTDTYPMWKEHFSTFSSWGNVEIK
jgi:5'-nucleotidase